MFYILSNSEDLNTYLKLFGLSNNLSMIDSKWLPCSTVADDEFLPPKAICSQQKFDGGCFTACHISLL